MDEWIDEEVSAEQLDGLSESLSYVRTGVVIPIDGPMPGVPVEPPGPSYYWDRIPDRETQLLHRVLEACAPGRVLACRLWHDGGWQATSEIRHEPAPVVSGTFLVEDTASDTIRHHARHVCLLIDVPYPEAEVERITETGEYVAIGPMTGRWGADVSDGPRPEPITELGGFVVGQVVRHKATGEQGVVVGFVVDKLLVSAGIQGGTWHVSPEALMIGRVWQESARSATELNQ